MRAAPAVPGEALTGATPTQVLGLLWEAQRASLARLDPLRLRPRGRVVEVPNAGASVFSPDGRLIAIGGGDEGWLAFVGLESMQRAGREIELPGARWVTGMLWQRDDRLVVLAGGDDARVRVFTVDPSAGEIIRVLRLPGAFLASDRAGGRLVALLAPVGRIGQATIAAVDSGGSVRTQRLAQISAGSERIDNPDDAYASREELPGVTISPDGARALVVPAAGPVAEIDLATLAVTYRELTQPVSVLERVRNWFEPEAQAKVVEGPMRSAVWFSDDLVAVTGVDYEGVEGERFRTVPAGLRMIDTRDWTVRTVAREPTGIARAGELLLAFGGAYDSSGTPVEGFGLRAYGPGGSERLHLFGDELIAWPQVAWPYAYVGDDNSTRFRVVDLRAGRVIATPDAGQPITIVTR